MVAAVKEVAMANERADRAKAPSKALIVRHEWSAMSDPLTDGWFAVVTITGLRTVNAANESGYHWRRTRGRNGRGTAQKLAVTAAMGDWLSSPFGGPPRSPPYVVTLTRVAPSKGLDPGEGERVALKAVRDAVAKALSVGDGPTDPVRWEYAQERGPWGVRIKVEWGSKD